MIYPENFESKIKFDKIRQYIKGYCLSDMGRQLVEDMHFSSDATLIREQLAETNEFMSILREEDGFPGDHFRDARPFLNKIRVEGLFLEIAEMVAFKNSLESLTAILRYDKAAPGPPTRRRWRCGPTAAHSRRGRSRRGTPPPAG